MKKSEIILVQEIAKGDTISILGGFLNAVDVVEEKITLRLVPFLFYTAKVIMTKRVENGNFQFLLSIESQEKFFFTTKPLAEDTVFKFPYEENKNRPYLPTKASDLEEGDAVLLNTFLYTVTRSVQVFEGDFYSITLVSENDISEIVCPKHKMFQYKNERDERKCQGF